MSRSSVRHAAATYLTNGIAGQPIPGLGTVFPSPPKVARSSDAFANIPAGTPSGSVVFVEILRVNEVREAMGGPTSGSKLLKYGLRFHLLFRSRQGRAQDAMDDHDAQVEAILQWLRKDRTLGTSGAILQFGQDRVGISTATGMPKTSGTGSTLVWTIIDGNALEFLTA